MSQKPIMAFFKRAPAKPCTAKVVGLNSPPAKDAQDKKEDKTHVSPSRPSISAATTSKVDKLSPANHTATKSPPNMTSDLASPPAKGNKRKAPRKETIARKKPTPSRDQTVKNSTEESIASASLSPESLKVSQCDEDVDVEIISLNGDDSMSENSSSQILYKSPQKKKKQNKKQKEKELREKRLKEKELKEKELKEKELKEKELKEKELKEKELKEKKLKEKDLKEKELKEKALKKKEKKPAQKKKYSRLIVPSDSDSDESMVDDKNNNKEDEDSEIQDASGASEESDTGDDKPVDDKPAVDSDIEMISDSEKPASESECMTSDEDKENSPSKAKKSQSPRGQNNAISMAFFRQGKKKETTPSTANETSPAGKKTTSASKKTTPAGKKTTPASKKTTPAGKKTTPASKKTTPIKKEMSDNSSDESFDELKSTSKQEVKPVVKIEVKSEVKSGGYHPEKENYNPLNDAIWLAKEDVPYFALAKTFQEVENHPSRLKMIDIVANFYQSVLLTNPDQLVDCVYLTLNSLAPAYEGIEIGVGDGVLVKCIAQSTGRSIEKVKHDVNELGDIGLVAENSRSNQRVMFKPKPLTVRGVLCKLREIAKMSGHSVMSKKCDKIKGMFTACKESEGKFLIRSLAGKLRIGMAEQSVLQALGQAITKHDLSMIEKKLSKDDLKKQIDKNSFIIKTTFCRCPNYDQIIPIILQHGVANLPDHCKLTPGIPLKPMLAHPTKGVADVLSRFEGSEFTCEYKYDGERAQIHLLEDKRIMIFSRNQENNTSKYPDIIDRFHETVNKDVTSCVIDTEAVAWDEINKQILPFQVLSTRKKKDEKMENIKVQVCVYAFDLLYLNGESLVERPFSERRRLLGESFSQKSGHFEFATSLTSSNVEDIGEFLENSIKGNCEGLMVKTSSDTYEIAKRSHNWLKLKKDYLDGVGDTLDLIVIGGYHGTGKRTGKYGGFLLGCYDSENEEIQAICKIGTGFTDENLDLHNTYFKSHIIPDCKAYVRSDVTPDVWFNPSQVWEVKAADLSLSPNYQAAIGLVDENKGISLRFPRFLRIREDKKVEDATTGSQIADMYNSQDQIINQAKNNKPEETDDY